MIKEIPSFYAPTIKELIIKFGEGKFLTHLVKSTTWSTIEEGFVHGYIMNYYEPYYLPEWANGKSYFNEEWIENQNFMNYLDISPVYTMLQYLQNKYPILLEKIDLHNHDKLGELNELKSKWKQGIL